MKRKLLLVLLTIIATFSCGFAFSGCDLFKNLLPTLPESNEDNLFTYYHMPTTNYNDGKLQYYGYEVKSIKDKNITEITIPISFNNEPVFAIGPCAFENCTNLKTVIFTPDCQINSIQHSAFLNCIKLENLMLPESLTTINQYAFENCKNLKKITVPNNVKYFDSLAFINCNNIATVSAPAEIVKNIPQQSLTELEIISNTADDMNNVCTNCTTLKTVKIADGVTVIGTDAFYNCNSLESIELPDSITEIGSSAFSGCTSLKKIKIPDNVTKINDWAFYCCTALTGTIILGDNITKIGNYAFYECKNISGINGGKNITFIGDHAFFNCAKLISIGIEEKTEYIGDFAFAYCTNLEYIYWNATDCKVYNNQTVFQDCYKISKIDFTENVKTIPAMFSNLGIYFLTLPSSLTNISDNAFSNCKKLIEICNKSSLNIETESSANGRVAEYAKNVYTPAKGNSKFKNSSGNFLFYYDDLEKEYYLMGANTYHDLSDINTLPDAVYEYGRPIGYRYKIYERAFYGNNNIKDITIPECVTEIGYEAFENCSSLESIEISDKSSLYSSYCGILYNKEKTQLICVPEAIKTIKIPDDYKHAIHNGYYPFLESYIVSDSHPTLSSIDGVLYNKDKTQILSIPRNIKGEINLPDTYINEIYHDFDNLPFLEGISVSDSHSTLSSIDGVLYNKDKTKILFVSLNIKQLYVPAEITDLSNFLSDSPYTNFLSLKFLEYIEVDETNPNYSSKDGVLYNKDQTEILFVPLALKQ